jgi:hypothetical protein
MIKKILKVLGSFALVFNIIPVNSGLAQDSFLRREYIGPSSSFREIGAPYPENRIFRDPYYDIKTTYQSESRYIQNSDINDPRFRATRVYPYDDPINRRLNNVPSFSTNSYEERQKENERQSWELYQGQQNEQRYFELYNHPKPRLVPVGPMPNQKRQVASPIPYPQQKYPVIINQQKKQQPQVQNRNNINYRR